MSIISFILAYALIISAIIMTYIVVTNLCKKGNAKSVGVIVISVIVAFLYSKNISIIGYTYNWLFTKILILGIYYFIVAIVIYFFTMDEIEILSTIKKGIIIAIIFCIPIWFFTTGKINNITFLQIPNNVTTHFKNKEIKRIAKKLNPEKELKIILEELKKENFSEELSKEKINTKINVFKYRDYNGIYCYAVENKDDKYIVCMVYGDIELKLKKPKHFTETNNFCVDKNTLEIIGVYNK